MKMFWYTDINDIRLPRRIEYLKPDIDREIIIVVSLKHLLKSLDNCYNKIYNQAGFFSSNLNTEKLINLTALWAKKKKILPPTIMINHNDGFNSLLIDNGIHRIKLAQYFDAEEIPILIDKNDEKKIMKLICK